MTQRKEKGEDTDGSTLRIIEGTDPANGKVGFANAGHKKTVLDYFRIRRQVDRVSPMTRRNDVQGLLTLSRFLDAHAGGKAFAEATRADMMAWSDALTDSPFNLRESTAQSYRIYVKRFFKWLLNPDAYLDGKQAQAALPYPSAVAWMNTNHHGGKRHLPADSLLSATDVRKMVEACSNPRDKALVMVLWDGGLRLQEVINLDVRNFQRTRKGAELILNSQGAGHKTGERRIFLSESVPFVVSHLNAHPLKGDPDAPLFYTRKSADYAHVMTRAASGALNATDRAQFRLAKAGVSGLLARIARDAGIKKHVHPHLFRHSRATFLTAQGLGEATLRQQFGWSATSKTPSVYQHLSGSHHDDAIRRALGLAPVEDEREPAFTPKKCMWGHENEPTAVFCANCGTHLSMEEAAKDSRGMGEEVLALLDKDPVLLRDLVEKLAKAVLVKEGHIPEKTSA